jgi:hypothetical protein
VVVLRLFLPLIRILLRLSLQQSATVAQDDGDGEPFVLPAVPLPSAEADISMDVPMDFDNGTHAFSYREAHNTTPRYASVYATTWAVL